MHVWRRYLVYGRVGGMRKKTTIYLSDDLKVALHRTALETDRSEADLIREGIKLVLSQQQTPPPRAGIFDSGDPFLSDKVDELLAGFGESKIKCAVFLVCHALLFILCLQFTHDRWIGQSGGIAKDSSGGDVAQ